MRLALLPSCLIATASAAIALQAQRQTFLGKDAQAPFNAMGGDRPMMGIADQFRSLSCWGKPKMMDDPKCMKFLKDACEDSTSGIGTCDSVKEFVAKECVTEDGKDQEQACYYAKKLDIKDKKVLKVQAKLEAKKKVAAPSGLTDDPIPSGCQAGPSPGPCGAPGPSPGPGPAPGPAPVPAPAPVAAPAPAPVAGPAPAPAFAPGPGAPGAPGAPAAPGAAGGMPLPGADSPFWKRALFPQPSVEEQVTKAVPPQGLPEQGFNGHSPTWGKHEDMVSATSDWEQEWPQDKKTEEESTADTCRKQDPMTQWCELYLKDLERRHPTAPGLPRLPTP